MAANKITFLNTKKKLVAALDCSTRDNRTKPLMQSKRATLTRPFLLLALNFESEETTLYAHFFFLLFFFSQTFSFFALNSTVFI